MRSGDPSRIVSPSASVSSLTWIVINNNIRSIYADSIRSIMPRKLGLVSLLPSHFGSPAVDAFGTEEVGGLSGNPL